MASPPSSPSKRRPSALSLGAQLSRQASHNDITPNPSSPTLATKTATSMNLPKLLQDEADAVLANDPVGMGSYYVIRKTHSTMASLRRQRSVMMIFPDNGMPSVVMITPAVLFAAWNLCRHKTQKEMRELQSNYNIYGKNNKGWYYNFAPSECKAKVVKESRFFQLVYCNSCDQDPKKIGVLNMTFAPDSEGKERKDKAFELRPEPYSKDVAAIQCKELVDIIRCGMVNSYLQRPTLIDRSMKDFAMRKWLNAISLYANTVTASGKTNLHHQVQVDSADQIQNISDLLAWGAKPDVTFGPTQMTALHMAASWANAPAMKMLLDTGADPEVTDVNGMTPLHLACVFGCLEGVKSLLERKVDVNLEASTSLGSLRPLDCAIECEEKAALDIWNLLCEHGADRQYKRTLQPYAEPYPMQRIGPFIAGIISLTRLSDTESELNIAKARMMVSSGADVSELDAYGRSTICQVTSLEMTQFLIDSGVDPNYGIPPDKLIDFAKGSAGVAYADVFLRSLQQLEELAFPSSGKFDDVKAPKEMAKIVLRAKYEVIAAARRALVSGYPLAEAITEGKLGKAHCLIEAGVDPLIVFDSLPEFSLNLVDYVGGGGEFEQTNRESFSKAVWENLGMDLLWFKALRVPSTSIRGTQLLQAEHSVSNSTIKTDDAQRKSQFDSHMMQVAAAVRQAEVDAGINVGDLAIIDFDPTPEELAQAETEIRTQLMSMSIHVSPAGSTPNSPPERPRSPTVKRPVATVIKKSEDTDGVPEVGSEAAAANEVTKSAMRERTKSNASAKLKAGESLQSYRERAVSFKRESRVDMAEAVAAANAAAQASANKPSPKPSRPPPPAVATSIESPIQSIQSTTPNQAPAAPSMATPAASVSTERVLPPPPVPPPSVLPPQVSPSLSGGDAPTPSSDVEKSLIDML